MMLLHRTRDQCAVHERHRVFVLYRPRTRRRGQLPSEPGTLSGASWNAVEIVAISTIGGSRSRSVTPSSLRVMIGEEEATYLGVNVNG